MNGLSMDGERDTEGRYKNETSVDTLKGGLSRLLSMKDFTKDDLDLIKSQLNEIVQHAEVLVNSLLAGDACKPLSEWPEFQEHILEAPEEFRTFNEEFSGQGHDPSLYVASQCREKIFEPERASAERDHDNDTGPEVEPRGWATPEEVGTCENAITNDRVNHVEDSYRPHENIEKEDSSIATNFEDLNKRIDGTNAILQEIQELFSEEGGLILIGESHNTSIIDNATDSSFHNGDKITREISRFAPNGDSPVKTSERRGGGASGHPKKPELIDGAVNSRPCDTPVYVEHTVDSDRDDVNHSVQIEQFRPGNREELCESAFNGFKCDLDNGVINDSDDEIALDVCNLFDILESDCLREEYRNKLNKTDELIRSTEESPKIIDLIDTTMFSSANKITLPDNLLPFNLNTIEEEDETFFTSANNNKLIRNNNVISLPEELPREISNSENLANNVDPNNKFNLKNYTDSILSTTSNLTTSHPVTNDKSELSDELSLEAISAQLDDLKLNQILKYRKYGELGHNLDKSDVREIEEDAEFEFIEELLRSLEEDDKKTSFGDDTSITSYNKLINSDDASITSDNKLINSDNNTILKNESVIVTGEVNSCKSREEDSVLPECVIASPGTNNNGTPLDNCVGNMVRQSTPTSDQSVGRQWECEMLGAKVDRDEFTTLPEPAWSTSKDEDVGRYDGACATEKTTPTSIDCGVVAECSQPPGCSREPTATVCTALDTTPSSAHLRTQQSITLKNDRTEEDVKSGAGAVSNLSWGFRNGRLVFDVPCDSYRDSDDELSNVLTSKDLNKKSPEGRLKFLEDKLKEAGITDGKQNPIQNSNQSPAIGLQNSSFEDGLSESSEDLIPSDSEDLTTSFCEFDVQSIHKFQNSSNFFEIYDELDEEEEDHSTGNTMRGDGNMGTNERKQHNPNRDNLRSLLKKPGRNKDKKNRVVFNETKNEFFDADYIILIREECDYDEEDDDGVCTCNQHEMVRLTCCEPNCNCNVYEGYDPTPQSPKFAPPLEFVDAVTLSPPEEYKDMELEEQQLLALQQQMARRGQRAPVCRECSASHDDEGNPSKTVDENLSMASNHGDGSLSDNEEAVEKTSDDHEEVEEKEKTDQSQQTTPTTPPPDTGTNDEGQRYILETLTMTTVSERQIIKEAEEKLQNAHNINANIQPGGSPISGILKGGRLWKQTSSEINNARTPEPQQTDNSITSDDEGNSKRSVRFSEANSSNNKQRDVCDGAPEKSPEEETAKVEINEEEPITAPTRGRSNVPAPASSGNIGAGGVTNSTSPESTEMMLTFKLGNHVLISNNSLKPNSAVRQLFPCTKPMAAKTEETDSASSHQYLVTAESLKAFEEAKRSKLPQIIQSGETDDSIRRAIERNTLRRSLIRYEPKSRKATQKTDNSLVERIKQLTCDVDEVDTSTNRETDDPNQQQRSSPPGEEARNSPEVNKINNQDKSFSPSSSSTASSNSSSMSSTYKKITDLFAKQRDRPDIQNVEQPKSLHMSSAPDLGNGPQEYPDTAQVMVKINPANEHRKQFLSTLAPLTACVSAMGPIDDYYHITNHNQGDRTSMASSVGTEYSLEDIDEVLRKDEEDTKKIAPDVLAGTPSASESGDELAMFVQQDAGRIERIKKKYQPEATEDDDEHDDYGFNRRPSVRGIKPRFGSTTEILQQIQNQMQPPSNTPPRNHVAWPYYSETNLSTNVDNTKPRNINQNGPPPPYPYPNQTADDIKRAYAAHQYRPTSYIEENIYQNCTDQRCTQQVNYRTNMNVYPSVVRVGGGCSDYYASLPRNRNGRPQSPPPQEVSKNYHQTMVYIPYNHIEGYHPAMSSPNPYYSSADACYARVTNQNQINKRYVESTYQRIEDHYSKPVVRQNYARSESPQISTARSTQTPVPNCTYYPPRYRAMVPNGVVWQEGAYVTKINRHSYPMPRYPPSDSLSLTDSDSQHSNGYRETTFGVQKDSMPNSPTKTRFIERGVPEGAASVSPQDSVTQNNSTMTSPTSPQNPQPQGAKPLFYAMNV